MIKRFGGHAGQESILNDHRRSSSEVPNEPSIDIAGEFAPRLATQQTQSHLDIERENLIEALGGALADTRNELLDQIEPQLRKISALELKLAELTGAVDVLRGKAPPPPAKFPAIRAWREDI